jgi:hypothetical protein
MTVQCPKGHAAREVTRKRVRETIEEVVYKIQKIKKFNREGAENMETVKIPEFVERPTDVDVVEYVCDECGWADSVRETVAEHAQSPTS